MLRTALVFSFFTLFMGSIAHADGTDESCSSGFAALHLDQDLFVEFFPLVDALPKAFVENEDRDYTMGLALTVYSCPNSINPLSFFAPQQALSAWLFASKNQSTNHSESYLTTMGLDAYTPDELNTADPVFDDRPYASLLYLTNSYILASEDHNSALETSVTLGVLGLGIGDAAQTWIHKINRDINSSDTPYAPLGWHHQIADGGQLTAMVSMAKYLRLSSKFLANNRYFDVVVSAQGKVGYNTSMALGVMGRFGFFRQNTPVQNVIRQGGYKYASIKENSSYDQKWEAYGFAGFRGHAVAYNALLQGQFGDDIHALSASQLRNFIYDYTIGAGFAYKKLALQLYCSTRSSEHFLSVQRSHSWCGTNFAFGF